MLLCVMRLFKHVMHTLVVRSCCFFVIRAVLREWSGNSGQPGTKFKSSAPPLQ